MHHYPRVCGTSTFFKPRNVVRTLRDLVVLWVTLTLRRSPAPNETSPHGLRPTLEGRLGVARVLAPFFVSRALSDAFLVAIGMLRTPNNVLAGFTSWDGRWYRAIALHGYVVPPHAHHHQTPWPFFPLLPEVLHVRLVPGHPVGLCRHRAATTSRSFSL